MLTTTRHTTGKDDGQWRRCGVGESFVVIVRTRYFKLKLKAAQKVAHERERNFVWFGLVSRVRLYDVKMTFTVKLLDSAGETQAEGDRNEMIPAREDILDSNR